MHNSIFHVMERRAWHDYISVAHYGRQDLRAALYIDVRQLKTVVVVTPGQIAPFHGTQNCIRVKHYESQFRILTTKFQV